MRHCYALNYQFQLIPHIFADYDADYPNFFDASNCHSRFYKRGGRKNFLANFGIFFPETFCNGYLIVVEFFKSWKIDAVSKNEWA